jgi:hypothetical protein
MEQIQEYLAKFRDGLPELFDKVIEDCDARIHGDLEDEYDIPESPYVESHPIIQLRECIYDLKSGLEFSDYDENILKEFHKFTKKITPLFAYGKLLPKNEKIVFIHITFDRADFIYGNQGFAQGHQMYINKLNIRYITNYGRIIIMKLQLGMSTQYQYQNVYIEGYGVYQEEYYVKNTQLYYKNNNQLVPDYKLAPLTHKFPKLFLNVINAFRTESTDDMQKCCGYYYSRIHEKDKLEKENKKLSAECESLKTKNKQLEKENQELREKIQVLEVDNARDKIQEQDQRIQELLMEIELLKIKNIEVRRLYKE